jgi:hypothetical protein
MSDELFEIRANLEQLNETIERRMIELVQAIDDLRRSLVIVLQERTVSDHISTGDDSYYWNHG